MISFYYGFIKMTINNFNLLNRLRDGKLLSPWWYVDVEDTDFKATFEDQLIIEVPNDHLLYGLDVELIARGHGDDCLFKIKNSEQVASVHLTWRKSTERNPFPLTTVYQNFNEWYEKEYIDNLFSKLNIPMDLTYFEQVMLGYSLNFITKKYFESYIYQCDSKDLPLNDNEYLSLISADFDNKNQVIEILNSWYVKKFSDALSLIRIMNIFAI